MPKKILVVDDEKWIATMVTMRLEAAGYEVLTAADGQEGLTRAQNEKPDLVVLDLMLPKMDGTKVCALLKNDTRYAHIPVIILTAMAGQQQVLTEVSADAYMMKPFDPPELLQKISDLLKEKEKV